LKAFLSLVLLILAAAGVRAESLGLIDQPQTFPWSVGLTPVVQEEAGGLDSGGFRCRTSTLWFNTFRQYGFGEEMSQLVDMEGLLQTVSVAWSPAAGWEIRGQVQGWVLGGGFMDILLSRFHGFFSMPNQGREFSGQNGYRDYLAGRFDETAPGWGLTQASFGVRAFSGPWSWTTWVKPPLPGPVDWGWTRRWSGGAGLGWGDSRLWRDFGFELGGGVSAAAILVEPEPSFAGDTGGVTGQVGLYGVVQTPWGFRGLAQGTWTRVPRTGTYYLSQGAGLLTTGIQLPLGATWMLEGAMTEEFLTWATMEVGFQLGFVWRD